MTNYYIESFKVTKLWGHRDIDLTFNNDVNILIGLNGSGKTTVLHLLYSILSVNLQNLFEINFDQVEIKLTSFKGRSVRTIKVNHVDNRLLKLSIGKKVIPINKFSFSDRTFHQASLFDEGEPVIRQLLPKKVYDELTSFVPIVWLPVSRRLPVAEDKEERYSRRETLESVDLRLKELLTGLSRYRSELNAQLSKRYRNFENQVLSVILYSKEHDHIDSIPSSLPNESEKKQLIGAFDAAGLLNEQMQSRIEEHFAAAEKVGKRISDNVGYELEDILVVPLISRTKSMVEYARKLEKHRNDIFAPLRLYEDIVNTFFEDKTIIVDESGSLEIKSSSQSAFNWRFLSSGEKQILILLTQALLRLNNPVVYIADEPELSLHVTWQEKLLDSLEKIGGQKQIIVATHSPDIVGKYRENVIILGKES